MNNKNENEILGFDPTQLDILGFDLNELNQINELEDIEMPNFEEEEKLMKETHIKHCIKNRKVYSPYPRYIYLAGKIEKNGWREEIVGYRCNGMGGGDYSKEEIADHYFRYNNDTIITGPWFLACDHGCYHGDNSHGLGINKLGCPEANGDIFSEKEVYDICIHQIDHSDIVFAYINDNTCYGSIYEIAYAYAVGKYVIIIFDNEELMSDMWFMCQGAHIVDVLGDKTVKEKFDEILAKISY